MNKLARSIAALAPVLLLAACGQGGSTGTLSLKLTDAPGDVKAAVVTISRIEITGESGTTVLRDTPVTTNLVSLANDVENLVTTAVVPSGTYSQLRFVITGGYLEVEQAGGGTVVYASRGWTDLPAEVPVAGTLRMPSFAQSGLKVDLPGGGVTVGTDSKVILVDFDVAQSFGHDAGNSGAWVMHPVIKAVELQLSGTVDATLKLGQGVLLPGGATLAQFGAVLTGTGGGQKTLPLVDRGNGIFGATFPYLIPGDYTLAFTAPSAVTSFTTDPESPTTVTVASGQPTAAAYTVTSAH